MAYPIGWLRERPAANDLYLREPFHQGSWTARSGDTSQDIVVADRR